MKKWFKVAQSGATSDGRYIKEQWLNEAAEQYNLKLYAARINCNHLMGMSADLDNPFPALGDVLALKTEKSGDVVSLFAQIDPTERLISMNKARQRVYTSIQIVESFADTGKAYLMALAVTDQPASLGTEMLSFCRNSSDFKNKDTLPKGEFTDGLEVEMDFTDAAKEEPSFLASIAAKFASLKRATDQSDSEVKAAISELADETVAAFTGQATQISDLEKRFKVQGEEVAILRSELKAAQEFMAQPDPTQQPRPESNGQGNLSNF